METHVRNGPCADPNPDQTWFSILNPSSCTVKRTEYNGIKAAEYIRRRADFEAVAFKKGPSDTLHGRVTDRTRRTEFQKKRRPA